MKALLRTITVFLIVLVSSTSQIKSQEEFIRGDANQSGIVDMSDAIVILGFSFLGENLEVVNSCLDSADANDDRLIDLSDPITILAYSFLGNIAPPAPGPENCGLDPTEDELTCQSFEPCEPAVSKESDFEIQLTVFNSTSEPADIYWINFLGEPVLLETLAPWSRSIWPTFGLQVFELHQDGELAESITTNEVDENQNFVLLETQTGERIQVSVRFTNLTTAPLELYSIGLDGIWELHRTLDPGAFHDQSTFSTDRWATVQDGVTLGFYQATDAEGLQFHYTQKRVNITLLNTNEFEVSLDWINNLIEERSTIATIAAGETYQTSVFDGNRLVAVRDGRDIFTYSVGNADDQYGEIVDNSFKSTPSDNAVTVTLYNNSSTPKELAWVNFDGEIEVLRTLSPWSCTPHNTFASRAFFILEDGEEVLRFSSTRFDRSYGVGYRGFGQVFGHPKRDFTIINNSDTLGSGLEIYRIDDKAIWRLQTTIDDGDESYSFRGNVGQVYVAVRKFDQKVLSILHVPEGSIEDFVWEVASSEFYVALKNETGLRVDLHCFKSDNSSELIATLVPVGETGFTTYAQYLNEGDRIIGVNENRVIFGYKVVGVTGQEVPVINYLKVVESISTALCEERPKLCEALWASEDLNRNGVADFYDLFPQADRNGDLIVELREMRMFFLDVKRNSQNHETIVVDIIDEGPSLFDYADTNGSFDNTHVQSVDTCDDEEEINSPTLGGVVNVNYCNTNT